MATTSLLDPILIAQLGNLNLRARRVLEGLFSGHHINRNRGNSKEFSQHRPYIPGDDLKGLDWKIFGRTDRLMIKQYEEETNVVGTVIMDDSASMNFGAEGRVSKLEYAKTMAAAIGYILYRQKDAIGLLSTKQILPYGSYQGHLEHYFQSLEKIEGQKIWDIRQLTEKVHVPLKKKGFVIVFSDLMAEPERIISTLRALHARKNEVLVFHILDPSERELEFDGPTIFIDSETKEELKTDPDVIRSAYRDIMKHRLDSFTTAFRKSGIDYKVLMNNTPFNKGMGSFLSWRGLST